MGIILVTKTAFSTHQILSMSLPTEWILLLNIFLIKNNQKIKKFKKITIYQPKYIPWLVEFEKKNQTRKWGLILYTIERQQVNSSKKTRSISQLSLLGQMAKTKVI